MRLLTLALCLMATSAQAEILVKLLPPWDGETVPVGQQCKHDKGAGLTPPMELRGLPDGTVQINLEFNDLDYEPLSKDGGHGIIGFKLTGPDATLPGVPGLKADLDAPAFVVAKARSSGDYASDGYLPPRSGGKKHAYSVTVKALDASGAVLEELAVPIGRY